MGTCLRIVAVILLISLAVIYQVYINLSHPHPIPKLDLNQYWGPGNKPNHKDDITIFPNKIRFSDEQKITDLKKRLNRSLDYLHEPLEGVNFEYGFNSRQLKKIIKYWRDDYMPRWREREMYLWSYPHLTTEIQGLNIHFIHTKLNENVKKTKKVFPVLLIHGWPGSVREFYDIIPKLSEPNSDEYVFEVVAPSLPGYGWSQAASKPGMGPVQMAVVLHNLMIRLGYDKFFIQGGDWGSIIGNHIAAIFPDNVIGYHSNMCAINSELGMIKLIIAKYLPKLFVDKEYYDFHFPIGEKLSNILEETGYFHIQATKPDTIGIALSDNPIGLAAYILEKFSTWTNAKYKKLSDGGLDKDIKMDTLLDNIMIYYLTNSITTSQRLYAEAYTREHRSLNIDRVIVTPPVGCARFKYDIAHCLDWQLEDKYPNLIHSTYYKNGGHFAAMEVPNVLYKDFITFVKKVVETPKPKSKVVDKPKVAEKPKVTEKTKPKQETKQSKTNNKK